MVELSVIIPTYNRAERLRACLEALARQTHSAAEFEVIVVIDGSTDGTHEMLASLRTPFKLHVVPQQNSRQGAARNRGVEHATGRYCLFLDDDIIAAPTLVAAHLRLHRERQRVVGIGQIELQLPAKSDWFTHCYAQGWKEHYARLNLGRRPPSWLDCYGGNMSLSRAAFLESGGFAIDLPRGNDLEFAYRLERQGLAFVYLHEASGTHVDNKCFRDLAADFDQSGACWVELWRRHPHLLPQLLGSITQTQLRWILLRRVLLALKISPRVLAPIGAVLRKHPWGRAWHAFLHNYCYWRGVQRAMPEDDTWRRFTHGTPILMYHAFGAGQERPSRYVMPQRRFVRQMALLKWLGYKVLTLEEFLGYTRQYRLPPPRSVVITIDDGYADSWTVAYPILRHYGFSATIFLVTDDMANVNRWATDKDLFRRPLLSWSDVHEMKRGGMEFGAHTRTHPVLTQIAPEVAQDEVEGARRDLEHRLNVPIRVFAYPYGEHNPTVRALVKKAGFLGACSAASGINTLSTPLYALHRTEIYGTHSILQFVMALLNVRTG